MRSDMFQDCLPDDIRVRYHLLARQTAHLALKLARDSNRHFLNRNHRDAFVCQSSPLVNDKITELTNSTICPTNAGMSDKEEKLFVRMSTELRNKIKAEAKMRGESEAVVVREALREYFAKDDITPRASRPELNERNSANKLKPRVA
jgi:hypothetical protein